MAAFSPRKEAILIYAYLGKPEREYLLRDQGKYKMGKPFIYVKKLSDIDLEILEKMIPSSVEYLKERYGQI